MKALTVTGGRKKNYLPRKTYKPSSYLNIKELNQFKLNTEPENIDSKAIIDWIYEIE